ncbi:hypothetical protein OG589_17600 [Sphaerisporangium sp. NBC_01403]|uniref:hypothetical protein n=1 Tax=Sphaerisporangium sp. NBC_01403 TaxID=2903599 RepID=UPI00325142BF
MKPPDAPPGHLRKTGDAMSIDGVRRILRPRIVSGAAAALPANSPLPHAAA